MIAIEDCLVGQTQQLIKLEGMEQNLSIARAMINAARRDLAIISRDLEVGIFADQALLDGIKKLALRSRFSTIRIIILKPENLHSRQHRLFALVDQLTDQIRLRKVGPADSHYNKAYLLVDDCAYIKRPASDRFEAEANFNDRKTVSELLRVFNQLWQHGEPDPNFRRLAL